MSLSQTKIKHLKNVLGEDASRSLLKVHRAKLKALKEPRYARYVQSVTLAKKWAKKAGKIDVKIKKGVVTLSAPCLHEADAVAELTSAVQAMNPWRKGPFAVGDLLIDAEWQSQLKWDRIKKHAGSLQGKVILDVGCNNGYYLYQIMAQNPKLVLGIDPTLPYYQQYEFISALAPQDKIHFLLNGFQDIAVCQKKFDVIFCLGIIYHHQNPFELLKILFNALRPGGMLIIETMSIPANDPICLLPGPRYMGMPGFWFIPSASAMKNMLSRSGFMYVNDFLHVEMTAEEQRATAFSPHVSFKEGLDDNNPEHLTKEGYPRPQRSYFKAYRPRVR